MWERAGLIAIWVKLGPGVAVGKQEAGEPQPGCLHSCPVISYAAYASLYATSLFSRPVTGFGLSSPARCHPTVDPRGPTHNRVLVAWIGISINGCFAFSELPALSPGHLADGHEVKRRRGPSANAPMCEPTAPIISRLFLSHFLCSFISFFSYCTPPSPVFSFPPMHFPRGVV